MENKQISKRFLNETMLHVKTNEEFFGGLFMGAITLFVEKVTENGNGYPHLLLAVNRGPGSRWGTPEREVRASLGNHFSTVRSDSGSTGRYKRMKFNGEFKDLRIFDYYGDTNGGALEATINLCESKGIRVENGILESLKLDIPYTR